MMPSTFAATNDKISAQAWLKQLSHALQHLNFSTSFVVVKNNQAEPYHWYHGVDSQGTEFEVLSVLNGPRRDTLRRGNVVSYLEPDTKPYSVNSNNISGPIPSVFRQNIEVLAKSYDFVSVGKSRILGRPAQIIRIVSKDANRYGYWLWLDQESGLLLKTAMITRKGHLLEQIQFTYLEITSRLSKSLDNLAKAELPKVIDIPKVAAITDFAWQVNWLPLGFERIKADHHRINLTKQTVEFMQFSDGLVNVSVYVSPSKVKVRPVEYVKDGATIVLNQVVNGKEISIVGKVPANTAKSIADSVSFRNLKH
ncbi:MAG: MucB/RseB C-terminal domain-containing protein [Alteromonadaceae bacterium]|nr:MucB/RseB C-terminal domain-containing protein [Alteromonadaceae bacterium]